MKKVTRLFSAFTFLFCFVSCSYIDSEWTVSGSDVNATIETYIESGEKLGISLNFLVISSSSLLIPPKIANETVVSLNFSDVARKTSMTSVTFPSSVKNFDSLRDFTNLRTIVFSEKLESIPSGAFDNCTSLSSITFSSEYPPEIPSYIFGKSDGTDTEEAFYERIRIYVPNGYEELYKTASENWAYYAEKISATQS